ANELGPVSNQAVSVQQGPQALVQALAQRLQIQQVHGNQVAVVRLDPPQMGVIELRISHDASGVQVHMQASNSEVGRQLMTVTDSLRQELLARSADAQITVSTSRAFSGGGQSDAQRQAWVADEDPEIGQALQGVEHAHTAHT
ncbi:MAG: flagellar hook-length control protein FliK, partial [Comamonas sp.]